MQTCVTAYIPLGSCTVIANITLMEEGTEVPLGHGTASLMNRDIDRTPHISRRCCFGGIVPYTIAGDGCIHLLLSREYFGRDAGLWSGFAGAPNSSDGGDIMRTAAREGYEESSGLLGTPAALLDILHESGKRVDVSHGVHFLLNIEHNRMLPIMFQGVQQALRDVHTRRDPYTPLLEKDCIRWFSEEDINKSIVNLRHNFKGDVMALLSEIKKVQSH